MASGMEPTLEGIKAGVDQLRQVAKQTYARHPARDEASWSLEDYLAGIDQLEQAIVRALDIPPCTEERLGAEKFARNVLAVRLYFRGRLCPKTGVIGRFHKKSGEQNIDWAPTELSTTADRVAAEPLRQIYKRTEACIGGHADADANT